MAVPNPAPPLTGLRAIELTSTSAGQGAGMYLADFGVDIIKVELPEGDAQRLAPPLLRGVGRTFLALNRGKRSAVVDWRTSAGRLCLRRLLGAADIAIVDASTEFATEDDLDAVQPRLILASVTPFGRNGLYADLPGYDPLVQAATGIMATSRDPAQDPISIGYRISEGTAAMLLAYGIVMALLARERTGRGQCVDVSQAQTAIAMQTTQLVWVAEDPTPPRSSYLAGAGCYRCGDGRYINVNAMQVRQQESMYRALGLEHVMAETADGDPLERQQTLRSLLEGMFETAPSTQWLRLLQDADVPSGPLLSRSDLFIEPQVLENGLRATVAHPAGGEVFVLGLPLALSETPARVGGRVPRLGEQTREVLLESGFAETEIEQLAQLRVLEPAAGEPGAKATVQRSNGEARRPTLGGLEASRSFAAPLHGVRVLDLATMYAGPGVANYLGDMGADVIKIEPPNLDDSRRLEVNAFVAPNSRAFMALNRNKRGIILDLRLEKAREIARRLAEQADVLVNNFRPGVAERFGVDYQSLSAVNPRLIYAWVTGFGSRGPYRQRPAYDNLIQVFSGVYDMRQRRSGEPSGTGTFIADCSGPMLYGFAIGAALWARERIGRGQLIDGSLLGLSLAVQSGEWVALADCVGADPLLEPVDEACPTIRCADDEFVCVALVRDEEWQALCRLLQQTNWATDERFEHLEDRAAHRAEIAGLLGPLFAKRPRDQWVELLRGADVPAVPVVARGELRDDPFIAQQAMFSEVVHPVLGRTSLFAVPVHLSSTPGSIRSAAPVPGQDTDAILSEAGYSQDEIRSLRVEHAVA